MWANCELRVRLSFCSPDRRLTRNIEPLDPRLLPTFGEQLDCVSSQMTKPVVLGLFTLSMANHFLLLKQLHYPIRVAIVKQILRRMHTSYPKRYPHFWGYLSFFCLSYLLNKMILIRELFVSEKFIFVKESLNLGLCILNRI